jgi:Collagenase and related proteases
MSEKKGYILSPKDICTIENIKEIIDSGTASLKIEGRMKRPEYVAGVVQAYRRAIDSVLKDNYSVVIEPQKESKNNRQDDDKCFKAEDEKKKLLQLFNREGFSRAYLFGNTGKDMMAYSFPKNTGLELGMVQKDLTIELKENISLKDGIRNGNGGFTLSKIIKKGKEVEEALKGDRVKLLPSEYKSGDVLYKMSDVKLTKELEEIYKSPYEKKIELSLLVKFKVDEPITLTTFYREQNFTIEGEKVQKALKKPLDKERIIEGLGKAGDTPFKFKNIEIDEFEEGFLPVSAINEVRRELVAKIENYALSKNYNKDKAEDEKANNEDRMDMKPNINRNEQIGINETLPIPKTIVYLSREEQLRAFMESDFKCAAINPFGELDFTYLSKLKGKKIFLKLPNIIKEEFESICKTIEERLEHIDGIITSNLGVISKFRGKTSIIGDYKLNIFNSYALDFYRDFINGSCLSVELNKKELKDVTKRSQLPLQVLLYGKVELMVSEYCAIGRTLGERCSSKNCNGTCKKGDFVLKDRMGEEFILKTDKFCRSYVYNGVPSNLIPHMNELKAMNIESFRIDFINEDYDEAKRILQSVKSEKWQEDFSGFTRGHFKRGVE